MLFATQKLGCIFTFFSNMYQEKTVLEVFSLCGQPLHVNYKTNENT